MGAQDGPGNIVSVEFEVFGQVQGVYFTKYCRDMGLQVGLGGWVKNSRSGTVIGKIQGERKKVEQILTHTMLRLSDIQEEEWVLISEAQSHSNNVYGKVQGVFFRKNTVLKGRELGLRGWCMNTSEGTVRGAMEGQVGKVAEMKYWLQNKTKEMEGADANKRKSNGRDVISKQSLLQYHLVSYHSLQISNVVLLRVSHSILMSSKRMKPKSGDWVVVIYFLEKAAITSLSSGSSVRRRYWKGGQKHKKNKHNMASTMKRTQSTFYNHCHWTKRQWLPFLEIKSNVTDQSLDLGFILSELTRKECKTRNTTS
uniref:acylphosphatase n=1 Tax=Timema poppense TaxID=170557 RepID=A0A7R9CVW9_TIMPO|nr:unnamed protein product [Timema poppensis]